MPLGLIDCIARIYRKFLQLMEETVQLIVFIQFKRIQLERIHIIAQHTTVNPNEVSVNAVVEDVQYLGAESRIRTRLSDGSILVAAVPSDGLAAVVAGSAVRLSWLRRASTVVADTGTFTRVSDVGTDDRSPQLLSPQLLSSQQGENQ